MERHNGIEFDPEGAFVYYDDAQRALDAERERLKGQIDYSIQLRQLIESLRRDDTPSPELYHHTIIVDFKRQLATLQAQLRQVLEVEHKYRKELWLGHRHHGMYGDDGEMQCIECHPYGVTDYKRDPLDKVEHAAFQARIHRATQATQDAGQGGLQ